MFVTNLVVFTTSGVWSPPPKLFAIDLILRGAGGGGGANGGGGGGQAVVSARRVPAAMLTGPVQVTIGQPGTVGNDGGATSFGALLTAVGGLSANNGGAGGGTSFQRGGSGGTNGNPGESVSGDVISLLTGGGGGAGSGAGGGSSGLVPADTGNPAFWQVLQSGGGGSSGKPGGYPAGGGGSGATGAAGVATVIHYLFS
ncbi:hypothetical protein [Nocardia sp. NBC_01388]|uniref:hypothetical protein n=1 Tax=Nocardia sp. NBC_01388 TaxID=2903596 RepID=UPI003247B442